MKTKRNNGMKAIFKLSVLATFILAVVSCSTEAISEDGLTDFTSTTAKAKKPRPIKNSFMGFDRFEDGVLVGNSFSGNISHGGKYTGEGTTTNFYFTSESEAVQTSEDFIVVANGDKIFTSSEVFITFTPESVIDGTYSSGTYVGGFDFVGGTGRFEGATGRMEMDNGVFDSGVAQHNAEGTITY
ncbi:hypothetical protein [Maribacter aestuarii]|uniref:hypothetical protein n=1 Tax=Maribacter aestuarii TaxID=1130723 RepID=UPI00248B1169|nr:hypothetical protein [Maribacter aestuarii]